MSKSIHFDTSLLSDNNELIDQNKDTTNASRTPGNPGSQNKMMTSTTPQTKTNVQRKKQQRPGNKSNIQINKLVHEQSLISISHLNYTKQRTTYDVMGETKN